jgi:hypothetical protein
MIEKNGRKWSGSRWLPKVALEVQIPARELYDLRSNGLPSLSERDQRHQQCEKGHQRFHRASLYLEWMSA